MAKTMKLKDISRLAAAGADIMRQPREVIVDGLEAIAQQLESFNSKQDDGLLIEAVRDLINVIGNKETKVEVAAIDLTPLAKALEPRPYPIYHFEIERNNRNQMTNIIATPESVL